MEKTAKQITNEYTQILLTLGSFSSDIKTYKVLDRQNKIKIQFERDEQGEWQDVTVRVLAEQRKSELEKAIDKIESKQRGKLPDLFETLPTIPNELNKKCKTCPNTRFDTTYCAEKCIPYQKQEGLL